MNVKTVFFSIFLLFILPLQLQASRITQIYEVTQPVVSQQNNIRNAAFEQGLIEVLVRVSGSSLAPTQLDITKAPRLVRKYRFQLMEQAEIDDHMKRSNTLVAPKYKLWMQFDDGKVKQLLKDNGLPIWGYQRPDVLVWLAVQDGKNRYLLKASDRSIIKDEVDQQARKRGLPIVWPKYDANDKASLKFIDVWGQFWEPVLETSQNYPVNGVLLGRMNWSNGRWQVSWSLSLENKTENWQVSAVDLQQLMSNGIGVATDHISGRFAVYADNLNQEELLVRVINLKNIKQYAIATNYLSSLAPVKNVFATDVREDYVDFHLELSGDEDDLKRIIALGKVLTPDTTTVHQPARVPEMDAEAGPALELPKFEVPQLLPKQHILQYRING